MSQDTIKGHWKELAPNIRQQWNRFTDEDVSVRAGTADYLASKVEERYKVSASDARQQVREFEREIQARRKHAAAQ